jgi:hypothetical protein
MGRLKSGSVDNHKAQAMQQSNSKWWDLVGVVACFHACCTKSLSGELLPGKSKLAQLRSSKVFHTLCNIFAALRTEEASGDIAIFKTPSNDA